LELAAIDHDRDVPNVFVAVVIRSERMIGRPRTMMRAAGPRSQLRAKRQPKTASRYIGGPSKLNSKEISRQGRLLLCEYAHVEIAAKCCRISGVVPSSSRTTSLWGRSEAHEICDGCRRAHPDDADEYDASKCEVDERFQCDMTCVAVTPDFFLSFFRKS
jgi:hypothetical protein